MNIRHSKPVFTTLFAAIALGAASLAGAAESGLSQNEQAAQNAIAGASLATSSRDTRVATLAQNETAAQHVIVVDYADVSSPIAVGGEAVALVANERAAQRAILDVPHAKPVIANAVASTPVAAR